MSRRFSESAHPLRQYLTNPSEQVSTLVGLASIKATGVLALLALIPAALWASSQEGPLPWLLAALFLLQTVASFAAWRMGSLSDTNSVPWLYSWATVSHLMLTLVCAAVASAYSPVLFYALATIGLIGFDWLFGWRRTMLLALAFALLYVLLATAMDAGSIEGRLWLMAAFVVAFHIHWLVARAMVSSIDGALERERKMSQETRRVMQNRVNILQLMADEFRGPYTNLKMLLQTPTMGAQIRRDAHRSIEEFLRLVDDLSRTAGIAPAPDPKQVPLELPELLYEVERKLRPLFRQRNIEFDLGPLRLTGARYCADLFRLRALLMAVPQAAALAAEPGSRFYLGFDIERASDSVHYLNILLRASDIPVTLAEACQTLEPDVNPDTLHPLFLSTGFIDVIPWIEALQARAKFAESEDGALELRVNVPLATSSLGS